MEGFFVLRNRRTKMRGSSFFESGERRWEGFFVLRSRRHDIGRTMTPRGRWRSSTQSSLRRSNIGGFRSSEPDDRIRPIFEELPSSKNPFHLRSSAPQNDGPFIFDFRPRRSKNPLHLQSSIVGPEDPRTPPSSIFGFENQSEDRTEDGERGATFSKMGVGAVLRRVGRGSAISRLRTTKNFLPFSFFETEERTMGEGFLVLLVRRHGADGNLRPNLRSEDQRCGGFFVLQGRRIEEPPVIFEEFRIPIFEEPPIFEEAPSHLRRTRSHLRSSAPKNEEPFPIFDLRGRRTKSPPPVTIIGAEERRAPIFNLRSSAPKIEEALRRNITCRNMSNRKDRPITVKVARGEK